jgi:plastocyanin
MPKDMAPQPPAEGSSEKDRPARGPTGSSLTGAVTVDGRSVSGTFGVVTLEPLGEPKPPSVPTLRVMEQRGRQFAPRMLVVPLGSVVVFPNFDPTFHNVFSTSRARSFDLGLYRTGEAREMRFDREGIVRVGCNLHANMSAVIAGVSAPHYTITSRSGEFRFARLEPGRYLLRAWAERSREPATREIEVRPGRNELTVDVAADLPAGPLPDKFGVPRASESR